MSWGDRRHIPSAEDIARMQQARKESLNFLLTKFIPARILY